MDGIEGMIHYSEFTPSEYYNLSEGQEINVKIKDLTDFDKHRRVVLEKFEFYI